MAFQRRPRRRCTRSSNPTGWDRYASADRDGAPAGHSQARDRQGEIARFMAHPAGRAASRENQDNLKDKSTAGQSLALAPSAFCASRLRSLRGRNGPEKTKTMTQPQAISQDLDSPVGRFIALLYGLAAYVAFFVTILYAIGFVSGIAVQKATIDTGTVVPIAEALIVNLLLMSVFAVQHSVMARKQFKQWWTQFVPKSVERSTYVLFWQWRPMPAVVWQVDNSQVALAVTGLSLVGWLTVFTSTFLINHFELFGVHQVANNLTGRQMPAPRFRTPFYYKFVRHPIYLVGDDYRRYKERVSMLLPWRKSA